MPTRSARHDAATHPERDKVTGDADESALGSHPAALRRTRGAGCSRRCSRRRQAGRPNVPFRSGKNASGSWRDCDPDSSLYNIAVAYHLIGPLDLNALEQGVRRIAERHGVLRATFPTATGQPVQRSPPMSRLCSRSPNSMAMQNPVMAMFCGAGRDGPWNEPSRPETRRIIQTRDRWRACGQSRTDWR